MTFDQLNIITPILKAISLQGYETPSPIQEKAIPVLLEGKDMMASAQTGTGKTAGFAIPIIQGLYESKDKDNHKHIIKALILAPTRELAEQIKDSFKAYSHGLGLKTEAIYGGVSQRNQEIALKKGIDILVATPGRLLDLCNQNLVKLDLVQYFVLDEADRMLDMGFIHDVRKILKQVPVHRQTMLFSATIPKEIMALSKDMLKDPVKIEVTPPETMVEKIEQKLFHVSKKDKIQLLLDLLVNPKLESVLIFTRTKHGANKLVKELVSYGLKADAIHGNKSQSRRQIVLNMFKNKQLRVLVATDIAARGIDIDELSHVINYDLPESAETYVHRMGRTGRAGLSGEAFTFCSQDELHLLNAIEKHIKIKITVDMSHAYQLKSKQVTEINQQSQSSLKKQNKPKKKETYSNVKKNFNEKEKKSYHMLKEEEAEKKEVFKRSLQPRKKPVVLKESDEKANDFKKSNDFKRKGYQPKDDDRYERKDQKSYGPRTGFESPYPKKSYASGPQREHSQRSSSESSRQKSQSSRPAYNSQKRNDSSRSNSNYKK